MLEAMKIFNPSSFQSEDLPGGAKEFYWLVGNRQEATRQVK
jgi:hypothetical protein